MGKRVWEELLFWKGWDWERDKYVITQVREEGVRETPEQSFPFCLWWDCRLSLCNPQGSPVEKKSVCSLWRSTCRSRELLLKNIVTLRETCAEEVCYWDICCWWRTPTLAGGVCAGLSPVGGMPHGHKVELWWMFPLAEAAQNKPGLITTPHPLPTLCWEGGRSKTESGKKERVEGKIYLRSCCFCHCPTPVGLVIW